MGPADGVVYFAVGLRNAGGGIAAKEQGWFASTSRHWNIDRPDPR